MNFRVALQYEFTYLGLDECLDHLKNHESDELAVQVGIARTSVLEGSSDVSSTMSIFISLPDFKSICVLLVF